MNAVVVGFGSIGPVHAKVLDEIADVNLYGICDIDKERADSGALKYGAKAFYSIDDCIKDENVDFVHICTPHYLHFENKKLLYSGGKLYEDKELICSDSEKYVGKAYWGNGHISTLTDLYERGSSFCLDDVINTMDVLFEIYEKAK